MTDPMKQVWFLEPLFFIFYFYRCVRSGQSSYGVEVVENKNAYKLTTIQLVLETMKEKKGKETSNYRLFFIQYYDYRVQFTNNYFRSKRYYQVYLVTSRYRQFDCRCDRDILFKKQRDWQ